MPLVTASPRGNRNGQVMTEFVDSVGTTSVTYTYPKTQETLSFRNTGQMPITVTVSGTSQTVQPRGKWEKQTDFTTFDIVSTSGVQSFEALSDEKGSTFDSPEGRYFSGTIIPINNVVNSGAKGDGSTNDRVIIQNTINNESGDGETLYFQNGQYYTDGIIDVPRNIKFLGNDAELKRNLGGSGRYFTPLNYAKIELDGVNPHYLTPHTDPQWDLFDYHTVDYKTANKKDYSLIDDFIKSINQDKILAYYNSASNFMYCITKNRNKVNWYTFGVLNGVGDVDTTPSSVGGTSTRMRNNRLYTNLKMYAYEKLLDARISIAAGTIGAETAVPTTFYPGSFQFTTAFNFRTIQPTTTFTYTSPNRLKNIILLTGTGASTTCTIKVDGYTVGTFNFKVNTAPEETVKIIPFPFEGKVVEITHTDGFTRFIGFNAVTEADSLTTPLVDQLVVYGDPIIPYLEKPEINYALLIGSSTGTNFKWAGGFHGGETRTSIAAYTDISGVISAPVSAQWQVVDAIYVDQVTRLTHPSYTGDVIEAKTLIKMDYMGYSHDVNFNFLQTCTINRAAISMSSNTIDVTDMTYIPNYGVVDLSAGTTLSYIRENALLKYNKNFSKPLVIANLLYDGNFSHHNFKYMDLFNEISYQSATPNNILKTYMYWIYRGSATNYETVAIGYKRTFRQRHIMQDYRMPIF